jgi:hypothetical protein
MWRNVQPGIILLGTNIYFNSHEPSASLALVFFVAIQNAGISLRKGLLLIYLFVTKERHSAFILFKPHLRLTPAVLN